jgi:Protein of unknown function (DUF3298)
MRILTMAAVLTTGVLVGWPGVAPAGAQPACPALGGNVEGDQICRGRAVNSVYTLDFSFPVDYPDQQAITDYLTQTRDGFINVAEMPGSRGLPYELDANGTAYRSGQPPHGSQSVVFKIFQDVGGAHPQTWYKAFNYDLDNKAPITYDTLFKPDSKPLDVIVPIVQRELQQQTGLLDGIPPNNGLDPAHYQNFAITDDAVIFFFGQGEMLPEEAGAIEASVPRAVLASMLAEPLP